MTPLTHIRTKVLAITQAEMATLAGTTQASVSRWERGELEPSRDQLNLIRGEAIRRGIEWNDLWFFERPEPAAEPQPTGVAA